jgi:hypothetical protein
LVLGKELKDGLRGTRRREGTLSLARKYRHH